MILCSSDERTKYLEIAYTAPEELLLELEVPVGILGYPRSEFDAMMALRFSRNDDGSVRVWPRMVIPKRVELDLKDLSYEYPTKLCKYSRTKEQSDAANTQCKVWLNYLKATRHGVPVGTKLSDT